MPLDEHRLITEDGLLDLDELEALAEQAALGLSNIVTAGTCYGYASPSGVAIVPPDPTDLGAGTITTVAASPDGGTTPPGSVVFTADPTNPGILILPVLTGSTLPANPTQGQTVFTGTILEIWSGSSWLTFDPLPSPVVQTSALVTTAAGAIAWAPSGGNGQVLTVQGDGSVKFAAAAAGVTAVTATAPVASSGGTTPNISLQTSPIVGTLGETLSNLPTTPTWRKYTVPFNDPSLNVAGTTATTTLCVLPAGAVLLASKLYHTVQAAAPGLAALTVTSQGIVNSVTNSYNGSPRTVSSAVGDRPTFNNQNLPDGGQAGTTTVKAAWVSNGANLNALTALSLDVYLLVSQGG